MQELDLPTALDDLPVLTEVVAVPTTTPLAPTPLPDALAAPLEVAATAPDIIAPAETAAIPMAATTTPPLAPADEALMQQLLPHLEAHFAHRLTPAAQHVTPPVSAAPVAELSEEAYERLLDRLEDHLENLLHQKLEAYVTRLRPSIVAQVMEEMRHDALKMVLSGDEGGT